MSRFLTFLTIFVFSFVTINSGFYIIPNLMADDDSGVSEEELEQELSKELKSEDSKDTEDTNKSEEKADTKDSDSSDDLDSSNSDDSSDDLDSADEGSLDSDSLPKVSNKNLGKGNKLAILFLFANEESFDSAKNISATIADFVIKQKKYDYLNTESSIFSTPDKSFIAQAKETLKKGLTAYNNLEVDSAFSLFDKSKRILEQHLNILSDYSLLSKSILYCGASKKLLDEDDSAKSFFTKYLTLNSDADIDGDTFSPEVVETFNHAKDDMEMLGNGKLSFKTSPKGAIVFVDGKIVGTTPFSLNKIKEGTHYFKLHKLGYSNEGGKVEIEADDSKTVEKDMDEFDDASFIDDATPEMKKEFGTFFMMKNASDTAKKLGVDRLLVVFVSVKGTDLSLKLAIVNPGDKTFKKDSMTMLLPISGNFFNNSDLKGMLGDFLESDFGYEQIASLATLQTADSLVGDTQPTKVEPHKSGSILTKWWFWTIVGVAAAGAGAGTYFLLKSDGSSGAKMKIDFTTSK